MDRSIRLADRRGLLQGRHLSPVQEYATALLLIAESREKAEGFSTDLKLALIGHDPQRFVPAFYPEAMRSEEPVSDEEVIEPNVTYVFDDDAYDPEEAEKLIEQMLAEDEVQHLSMAGDDEGWV